MKLLGRIIFILLAGLIIYSCNYAVTKTDPPGRSFEEIVRDQKVGL